MGSTQSCGDTSSAERGFYSKIARPTLLLDRERALRNIARIAEKTRRDGVRFRPHFKTHQSAEIGEWIRAYGVEAICVSSVEMAGFFADHGWRDITIAFPMNWMQIDAINQLAQRIALGLLVESEESVGFLSRELRHPADIWVDVDTGYGRTGLPWDNGDAILRVVKGIAEAPQLSFRGVLSHAGHAYYARSPFEVVEIHNDTLKKLQRVRGILTDHGYAPVEISVGDTPGASLVEDLSGADEIRPGTFVTYDVQQVVLGSCTEEDIAIAVACPVVAKYPERNEVITYGGGVHLSKDYRLNEKGEPFFGWVAPLTNRGWGPHWTEAYVADISQEVGKITASDAVMRRVKVGEPIAVLPVHACLTINQFAHYVTLEGEVIPIADYTQYYA